MSLLSQLSFANQSHRSESGDLIVNGFTIKSNGGRRCVSHPKLSGKHCWRGYMRGFLGQTAPILGDAKVGYEEYCVKDDESREVSCFEYGDGSKDQPGIREISTQPKDLGPVDELSMGGYHACAIDSRGRARCWASGWPKRTAPPSQLGKVRQISTGMSHACAIKQKGGQISCWGEDLFGQSTVPERLRDRFMLRVVCGEQHTCAIDRDYNLHCWGRNDQGQAAVPDDLRNTMIRKVFPELYHTCVETYFGRKIRCFGFENFDRIDKEGLPANFGPTSEAARSVESYGWRELIRDLLFGFAGGF